MWILVVLLVVLVAFWIYGMITSKDFHDANIGGWKASARERIIEFLEHNSTN